MSDALDRGLLIASRIRTNGFFVAACCGTIGLELLAYALTRERFMEGLVVLVVGVPSCLLVSRAEARALGEPKPGEVGTQRTTMISFSILFVVFLRSLLVRLDDKYPGGHDGFLQSLAIAMDMLVVACSPIVAYCALYRYRAAKRRATEIVA